MSVCIRTNSIYTNENEKKIIGNKLILCDLASDIKHIEMRKDDKFYWKKSAFNIVISWKKISDIIYLINICVLPSDRREVRSKKSEYKIHFLDLNEKIFTFTNRVHDWLIASGDVADDRFSFSKWIDHRTVAVKRN